MEQKLVIHPAINTPREGDIIIELTDIQLHTNRRVTPSAGNAIERSIASSQPGRIVAPLNRTAEILENNTLIFSAQISDQEQLLRLVQKYQQQGRRVFLKKPQNGLPVTLGKDTSEFIKSIKGERLLRRLAKQG